MVIGGRYRVVERLGTGGMATVLLAQDERLGRQVALKRLHPEVGAEVAQRFEREARLGASLSHPNVVSVYDVLAHEDQVVLVMEYVEGRTLAEVLSEEKLTPGSVIELLRPLASALDHAHREGVVHRDVKPANLLVRTDGTVKLADLGIATGADLTSVTATGTALGTVAYMAPEQIEGRRVSPAADVYALAAVAFEMLSGRKARLGSTPMEIVHRIATEGPPDLTDAWPTAPPEAAEVLRRAMSAQPADRPTSAGELVSQLEQALELDAGTDEVAQAPPQAAAPQPPPAETITPQPPRARTEPTRPTASVPTGGSEALPRTEPGAAPRSPAASGPPTREGAALPAPHRAGPPRRERAGRPAPGQARPPRRRRARVVTVIALVSALAAAGALVALTSSDDEPSPAAKSRKESGQAKDKRAAPAPGQPEEVVRDFYERAADDRYKAAWALAGPSARVQLLGFDSFQTQFATLQSISFDRAQTTSQTPDRATVAVATTAVHSNRTDRCRGEISLVRGPDARRWLIDRIGVDC